VVVSVAPTDLVSVEPGLLHYTAGQDPGWPPPTLRRWSLGFLTLRESAAGPSDPASHGGASSEPPIEPEGKVVALSAQVYSPTEQVALPCRPSNAAPGIDGPRFVRSGRGLRAVSVCGVNRGRPPSAHSLSDALDLRTVAKPWLHRRKVGGGLCGFWRRE
jgi:hypothetical protein